MIPSWLSALTGANKFAAPGGQANFGDLLQAGGHSIMQHYRGQGGQFGAEPPLNLQALIQGGGQPAQPTAQMGPPITGQPLMPTQNAQRPFSRTAQPNPWGIGQTGGVW
jgi:hypothetical protein